MLNDLFDEEKQRMEHTKELFNPELPKSKTELSEREMKIIASLYCIYGSDNKIINKFVDELIVMRMSLKRKSREEFVEVNKENKKIADRINGMSQPSGRLN